MDMDPTPSSKKQAAVTAQLLVMGHAPLACALADVSEHGTRAGSIAGFAELIRGALALKRGDVVDMLIDLGAKAGTERVRTEVVRIAPNELHLRFTAPESPALKRALACVASVRQRPPQDLLKELHQRCDAIGKQLMHLFIDAAEVDLFQAARDAGSNGEQQALFDSLYQINSQKEHIAQAFLSHVREGFVSSMPMRRIESIEGDGSELAVVDREAFEDWLSVKALMRGLGTLTSTMDGLAARYSLLASKPCGADTMPFGVPALCYALQRVLSDLKLPLPHRVRLYQCFERAAAVPLPPFYQSINEWLIQSGILPLWIPPVIKPDPAPPATAVEATELPAAAAVQPATMAPTGPVVSNGEVASRLYGTLRTVMSLREKSPDSESGPQISNDELLKLLDTLERSSSAASALGNVPLLASLQQALGQAHPQARFMDETEHRIELVQGIFDGILSDRAIAESAKPMLRQLEVPLLKVVLQDDTFLTAPDHPARRLLNQLAVLGSTSDLGNNGLPRFLEKITQQIVAQPTAAAADLDKAASDVDRLLKLQNDVHERNLQRVVRTYDGQEKLERGNAAVREALLKVFTAPTAPALLIELLESGWRELMLFDYVKYGADSHQWGEHLQTIGQLYRWLVKSDDAPASDTQEQRQEAETLLNRIERELEAHSPGQYRFTPVTRQLRDILLADQIDHDGLVMVPVRADDPTWMGGAVAAPRPRKHVPGDALARWISRARTLVPGDWMGPMQRSDSSDDLRLAWVSHDKYRFVFVNRLGQKAADLTIDEVAHKLQQGWQKLDAQTEWSAVDKSMYQMLQRLYDELDYRRSHDDLTGLVNRKEFETIVDHSLVRIKREESHGVLLYIDLDRFRLVNDYCGLDAGDRLLQEIGRLISSSMPENAHVARMGSNEFSVLLEHCSAEEGEERAEALRYRVQEYRFDWQQKQYSLTASVGMADIDMYSGRFVDIYKAITAACLSAKEHGGNRVTTVARDHNARAERDDVLNWVSRINRALDGNTLKLRCQKIAPLSASSDSLIHYEVLLGVEDEEKKVLIAPDRFIYAAEQFNRMQDVDRWVVRNTVQWMSENPEKMQRLHAISINLSGNSLNDDYFLDFIADLFRTSNVPAHKICFEVTETATIANLTKAADFIRQVKQMGCEFALDDFGTGLSSYEYLKSLPVDYLKIDGCFVRDMANNAIDYAVVKSINEIGHFMGKKTIAEFVENDAIAEKLREIGVDFVQGYGIERPKMLADV
jgi:diguanylate cyclase (GGDEF)-like protein